MDSGKINLLHSIADTQPDITFKFKKMKNTPAKIYERNVMMILALSFLMMIGHDIWREFYR